MSSDTRLTAAEVAYWADRLDQAPPETIVAWAWDTFGDRLALASSFGAEDMCLIDMLTRVTKTPRVFYLDTGVLFPETYALIHETEQRYGFRAERVLPRLTLEEQAERYGDGLWARDPDTCCMIRKVEPLTRYLAGVEAWMTGIRRDQTPFRANARVVERDEKFGVIKVNPLARWRWEQVWAYLQARGVPYNPLHDQGYPSIGCAPCTRAVRPGEDPRAGRWAGFGKTECGLHK
ncbi:MAG: phosphoadenylyl-sulfate reductase [Actinomycetia bacterium]|nr:phosphoadenylyl-sulfate reductase [Actinomycetes bacterium]